MKIISISGLDGSGKSTQIELLKNYLESQGEKVSYFHAVQFSIAQKLSKQKNAGEAKGVTEASWLQIQLRKVALFIDLLRFRNFLKKLEKEEYDLLLSDRYFYDNIINIAYLSNSDVKYHKNIPRPDYAFYLNTNPASIMKRNRVPDQGIEYLQQKKILLDSFSKEKNLTTIDGDRDQNEIHKEIRGIIGN